MNGKLSHIKDGILHYLISGDKPKPFDSRRFCKQKPSRLSWRRLRINEGREYEEAKGKDLVTMKKSMTILLILTGLIPLHAQGRRTIASTASVTLTVVAPAG